MADQKLEQYQKRLEERILVENQYKSMSLEDWSDLQKKVLKDFYKIDRDGEEYNTYPFSVHCALDDRTPLEEVIIGKSSDSIEDIEKLCATLFETRPEQCFGRIYSLTQKDRYKVRYYLVASVDLFKRKALRDISSFVAAAKGQVTARSNYIKSAKFAFEEEKRKKQEVKNHLKKVFE